MSPRSFTEDAFSRLSDDDSASTRTTSKRDVAAWRSSVLTKPKRPLSAYNLFFQMERAALIGETPEALASGKSNKKKKHGKITFANLAKVISARWKTVDDDTRTKLMAIARHEKERYHAEMREYRRLQELEIQAIQREEEERESSPLLSQAVESYCLEPLPWKRSSFGGRPSIAELAEQLDDSMTDIIIKTFL